MIYSPPSHREVGIFAPGANFSLEKSIFEEVSIEYWFLVDFSGPLGPSIAIFLFEECGPLKVSSGNSYKSAYMDLIASKISLRKNALQ